MYAKCPLVYSMPVQPANKSRTMDIYISALNQSLRGRGREKLFRWGAVGGLRADKKERLDLASREDSTLGNTSRCYRTDYSGRCMRNGSYFMLTAAGLVEVASGVFLHSGSGEEHFVRFAERHLASEKAVATELCVS